MIKYLPGSITKFYPHIFKPLTTQFAKVCHTTFFTLDKTSIKGWPCKPDYEIITTSYSQLQPIKIVIYPMIAGYSQYLTICGCPGNPISQQLASISFAYSDLP